MKIQTPNYFPEIKGNELKDLVQQQAIDYFYEEPHNQKVLYNCYVGFGKTNIAKGIIKRESLKLFPFDLVIVVAPLDLNPMWNAVCLTLLQPYNIPYRVMTFDEYTVSDKDKEWTPTLLIVDEVHRILNRESQYFSTALRRTHCSNMVLLSGSLNKEQLKFLEEHNITRQFYVSKLWGYKNSLVPQYTIYAIPIEFTVSEKAEYLRQHSIYEVAKSKMARGGIFDVYTKSDDPKIDIAANELGWARGAVIGTLNKWRNAYVKRNTLLYNAENKQTVLLEYLNVIKEKAFVFCMSIDFANDIYKRAESTAIVHSKRTDKQNKAAMSSFKDGTHPHLISIGKNREGIDEPSLRFIIRTAYNSSETTTEQIGGRMIRLDDDNPDKEAAMFCFYVPHIKAYGDEVKSQELKWLKDNLQNEFNVEFLKDWQQGLEILQRMVNDRRS